MMSRFAGTYEQALETLMFNHDYCTAPRGKKIYEILNANLEVSDPYSNMFSNAARDLPERYLKDELKLYFMGIHRWHS